MAEHRVPVLSASLHRYVDPSRSSDPRIRAVVAQLATLDPAPAPRAHFRAELRAQLVAVAPRLIAEGTGDLIQRGTGDTASAPVTAAAPLRAALARLRQVKIGRPLAIVTSVVAIFAFLLGGAVWVSHKALPGDTLYGLKRASENMQYSLTSGDTPRSKELLAFAKTRADEVTDLLSHASAAALGAGPQAGGISASTAKLVTSTLASADDDVRKAAQILGGQAVRNDSTAPLAVMTGWAPAQLTRLELITGRIPTGTLHTRAQSSATLVADALARAQQLKSETGCSCLSSSGSDDLGPLPCSVCGTRKGSSPNQPGQSPTQVTPGKIGGNPNGTTGAPGQPGGPGSQTGTGATTVVPGTGTGSGTAVVPGGSPTPGTTPTPGAPPPTSTLPIQLPTLPSITPPVTIDNCGLNASLGPIGIGIGTCGIHLHL